MKNDQTTKFNQNQNYYVLVREEAGIFILSIPELGVTARHQSLDDAYRELQVAKESHIKNLWEAGMGSTLPEPSGPSGMGFKPSALKNISSQMLTFTAKVLVVFLLLFGMGSVGLVLAGNIASKGMGRLISKIERYQPLEKAVLKIEGLSDAEVEEISRQLRRVSKKLQPLVGELKIIWESDGLKSLKVNQPTGLKE